MLVKKVSVILLEWFFTRELDENVDSFNLNWLRVNWTEVNTFIQTIQFLGRNVMCMDSMVKYNPHWIAYLCMSFENLIRMLEFHFTGHYKLATNRLIFIIDARPIKLPSGAQLEIPASVFCHANLKWFAFGVIPSQNHLDSQK